MQKTARFALEKETKGTFRFKEQPESGQPPVVGTLYVQKWAVPEGAQDVEVVMTFGDA